MADRQRPLLPECVQPGGAESKPRVRDCILPDVQVPDGPTRTVTAYGRDMKAMLLVIDTYIGRPDYACWASLPTLAWRCQISRSKAIRLLAGLEKLGVITCDDRRIGSRNVIYRGLCLPRIAEFSIDEPVASQPFHSSTAPSQSSTGDGQSSTAPSQSSTGDGQSSTARGSQFHLGGTRNPILKTISKTPSEELTREQGCEEPSQLPRGVGWGFRFLTKGWTLAAGIRTQQLIDPASLFAWHAAAVERDLVSDDSDGRRMLFALCRYVWRKRREKRNPIGWFHSLLEARRAPYWWQLLANEDEEFARTVLVARKPRGPSPAVQDVEHVRRRDALVSDLRAAFPGK